MRDEILSVMRQKKSHVSFVELQLAIGEESHGDFMWLSEKDENVVIWHDVSEVFMNSMLNLIRDGMIEARGSSKLVYVIDGRHPDLPVARRLMKNGYKTLRWLPVTFDLKEGR